MERPIYFKPFYRVIMADNTKKQFEHRHDAENYYFDLDKTQRKSCMEIYPSGGHGHIYYEGQSAIHIQE